MSIFVVGEAPRENHMTTTLVYSFVARCAVPEGLCVIFNQGRSTGRFIHHVHVRKQPSSWLVQIIGAALTVVY